MKTILKHVLPIRGVYIFQGSPYFRVSVFRMPVFKGCQYFKGVLNSGVSSFQGYPHFRGAFISGMPSY